MIKNDHKNKKMNQVLFQKISGKIISYLALLSTIFIITACEKKTQETTDNNTENQTLTIWTDRDEAFLRSLGQEFSATEGNTGQFHIIKFDSSEQLEEFFFDSLAEGKGPDLIFMDGKTISENLGKFLPIINDPTLTTSYFQKSFVPIAFDLLTKGENDTLTYLQKTEENKPEQYIYGIPFSVETLATIYNIAHIETRLKETDDWATSWEKIQKSSKIMTQKDNSITRFSSSGISLGRMDNIYYADEILLNIFYQMGVKILSPDQHLVLLGKSIGMTSNGIRKNLTEDSTDFFRTFSDKTSPYYMWNKHLADNNDKNFRPFLEGKLSVIFGHASDLKKLKNLHKKYSENNKTIIPFSDIRTTYLPQVDGNESRKILGKIHALVVPTSTKDAHKSWDFLKFSSGRDVLLKYSKYTQQAPARSDILTELSNEKNWGIFVRQANVASDIKLPIKSNKFQNKFQNSLNNAIESKISTKKWLETFSKNLQYDLDSLRRISNKLTQQ